MRIRNGALLALAPLLAAMDPAEGQQPEVFLPGVVTLEGHNVYRGTFHPAGDSFWFFRKLEHGRDQYRIYVTRRGGDGWGPPEPVDLGGDHSDLYPTFSPDGRVLVFTSYRPTPEGSPPQANLWYAEVRDDGGIGPPLYWAEASTPTAYDAGPQFDQNGWLGWTSETWGPDGERLHRRARWDGTGFGPSEPDPMIDPWRDWRDDLFVWKVTESPNGEWLAIEASPVDRAGRRGTSDIWLARRTSEGWSEPEPPAPGVNTGAAYENFLGFTPDSERLLFVRDFSTYYALPLPGGS